MATTTPNFGWPVPTSTDLVKDGATAIEALGDGIDTSLVDLKGGTTGQILAKATSADMDFAWITNDVGDITAVTAGTGISGGGTSGAVTITNSMATEIAAKGDLIVGTGAATFDNLTAGSNGETLIADSSTTTGLRYQGNFAAGKNLFLNGDCLINQRSFTSTTTTGTYMVDRWSFIATDGGATASVEQFSVGTNLGGENTKQHLRFVTTGQTATTVATIFRQAIENVTLLAGRTITLSFWAKSASGTPKIAIETDQQFGTGGSPSTRVRNFQGQVTLSTTWERKTLTFTMPSISGKTLGTAENTSLTNVFFWVSAGTDFNANTGSLGIQSNTFDVWGLQVEIGSVATAFQTATGTIQGELAACQRYYFRASSDSSYKTLGFGYAGNVNALDISVVLPSQMRVIPTALDTSAMATFYYESATGGTTPTSVTLATRTTPNLGQITFTKSGSFTVGYAYSILSNNTAAFLGFSAEL